MDLIACYIGDGYCVGITESEHGNGRRYWFPADEEDTYCRAYLENVPEDVAAALVEGVGGSGVLGLIGDGYDLASAAAPYAGPVIECQGCPGEHCPLCG